MGRNEAQHPASIETSASTAHAVSLHSAHCTLQSEVCTLHSALCTLHTALLQSVCRVGLQQMHSGVSRTAASSPSCSCSCSCSAKAATLPSVRRVPCPFPFPSHTVAAHTRVNMRPKPCHVRRISHPCHPKATVVRCACSSVDLQTTKGGASNPQALGVQVARSLSCFTAAVDPAAHQTTQLPELISSLTISHGISQCSQPCGLGTAPGALNGIGDFALSLGPREMRTKVFSLFNFFCVLGGA